MLPGASRHVDCASGTLSHARFVSLAVSGQVLDMHKSDLRDEEVGFAFLGKFSLSSLLQPFLPSANWLIPDGAHRVAGARPRSLSFSFFSR